MAPFLQKTFFIPNEQDKNYYYLQQKFFFINLNNLG